MNTTHLKRLKCLKLLGTARSHEAILQLPIHQYTKGHALLYPLVDVQQQRLIQDKTRCLLKQSKLCYAGSMEEITGGKERNFSQEEILFPANGALLNRTGNILISGATDERKSFLARALGHRAYQLCLIGYCAKPVRENNSNQVQLLLNRNQDEFLHPINNLNLITKLLVS